ncbi:DUF7550 family protein [Salinarchaeum laminariae]|uniref:DUF7550 family protein n=1 Tax=Salinarchaeum laminariae TaxID=869888 RepID=UPI0020C11E87|nr:hypothetical protein [Salinarchaeum laminariae]
MSDDEKESDSVGPDIDLEKIANDSDDDGAGHDDHDHGNHGDESHGHDAHDHDSEPAGRTTAPQSEFTMREAAIGGVVTAVGLVVAYGVPALLA